MSLGPIMLDVAGTTLSDQDRQLLQHPLVGGVILFSRNFQSIEQLTQLTHDIHTLRSPPLLIAVDHEGGRVQRFREGFTTLPPCAIYGELFDQNPDRAVEITEQAGWLLATELRAGGVDLSFAPILDVHRGISKVIDNRAFHRDPDTISQLANALMQGMKRAGMAAVGKHFPGHGGVIEDSHHELPIDQRPFADLLLDDLVPFQRLIHYGLPAIMTAHLRFPAFDDQPVSFSEKWLKTVLRGDMGFQGAIFSDDLSMGGAAGAGSIVDRCRLALNAGCDMILICNDRPAAIDAITHLGHWESPASQIRLLRLHGREHWDWQKLRKNPDWKDATQLISSLETNPELALV
ncbi:MAG: beta-N-acetylhexosaminidase [Pseudomonadota bacterium]